MPTTFLKPILKYAAPVWTPHTTTYINKLEAVQKHATHFIMSDYCKGSSVKNAQLLKMETHGNPTQRTAPIDVLQNH